MLAERKAAIEAVKKNGQSVIPIMLGMLDPRQKTTEYTRIGILRLLIELVAAGRSSFSKTLAFLDAVYDPYIEARREACRTIKALQDDLSVNELGRYAFVGRRQRARSMAAYAARELDDNRLFIAIIKSIPVPEVTANNGPGDDQDAGNPNGARRHDPFANHHRFAERHRGSTEHRQPRRRFDEADHLAEAIWEYAAVRPWLDLW